MLVSFEDSVLLVSEEAVLVSFEDSVLLVSEDALLLSFEDSLLLVEGLLVLDVVEFAPQAVRVVMVRSAIRATVMTRCHLLVVPFVFEKFFIVFYFLSQSTELFFFALYKTKLFSQGKCCISLINIM